MHLPKINYLKRVKYIHAHFSCFQLFGFVKRLCVRTRAQLCPTLCDLMDCSPPSSSVHGIFQARILEWVYIFYSRHFYCHLPDPGKTHISWVNRRILYHCATWETQKAYYFFLIIAILWYQQRIGSRTPIDTKICGYYDVTQ